MKYLIIGAGVAGVSACQAIREKDAGAELLVLTEEQFTFYTRLRLPDLVAGRIEPAKLVLKDAGWFDRLGIELRLNTRAEAIRPDPLRVIAGSEEFVAEKVLIATGADSFLPPVEGSDLGNVFTLRRMNDALAIRARAAVASGCVIIGGGVLGFEIGEALRSRGLEVTVVEIAERLLPRQTDASAAGVIRSLMERRGFEVVLGVKPVRFIQSGGEAEAIALSDGRSIAADLFIISAGVKPRVDVATASGIKTRRGIVIDDSLQTSLSRVFAAGDCTEHKGILYGIWRASEEQGRFAGLAMAGERIAYSGTVRSYRLNLLGTTLLTAGMIEPSGNMTSEITVDEEHGIYRRIIRDGGRVVGMILLGDLSGYRELLAEIQDAGRSNGQPAG